MKAGEGVRSLNVTGEAPKRSNKFSAHRTCAGTLTLGSGMYHGGVTRVYLDRGSFRWAAAGRPRVSVPMRGPCLQPCEETGAVECDGAARCASAFTRRIAICRMSTMPGEKKAQYRRNFIRAAASVVHARVSVR